MLFRTTCCHSCSASFCFQFLFVVSSSLYLTLCIRVKGTKVKLSILIWQVRGDSVQNNCSLSGRSKNEVSYRTLTTIPSCFWPGKPCSLLHCLILLLLFHGGARQRFSWIWSSQWVQGEYWQIICSPFFQLNTVFQFVVTTYIRAAVMIRRLKTNTNWTLAICY